MRKREHLKQETFKPSGVPGQMTLGQLRSLTGSPRGLESSRFSSRRCAAHSARANCFDKLLRSRIESPDRQLPPRQRPPFIAVQCGKPPSELSKNRNEPIRLRKF